jgi:hypothetical protein
MKVFVDRARVKTLATKPEGNLLREITSLLYEFPLSLIRRCNGMTAGPIFLRPQKKKNDIAAIVVRKCRRRRAEREKQPEKEREKKRKSYRRKKKGEIVPGM